MYTYLYIIILFLGLACMLYMTTRDYKNMDHTHWTLVIIMQFVNLGYVALSASRTTEEAILANDLLNLDGTILPLIYLLSLLSALKIAVPKVLKLAAYILSIAHLGLICIGSRNGMYFSEVSVRVTKYGAILETVDGPLKFLHYVHVALMFAIMFAVLLRTATRHRKDSDLTAKTFLNLTVILVLAYAAQLIISPEFEFLPVVYVVSLWIVAYCYEKRMLYDIEKIVSTQQEKSDSVHGYMAFDLHRRYLGGTRRAIEMIPQIGDFAIDSLLVESEDNHEIVQAIWEEMDGLEDGEKLARYVKVNDITYKLRASYYSLRRRDEVTGYVFELTDDSERQQRIDFMEKSMDIERREKELLRQMTEQAKAESEAKGRFLANMSHEIRTPINAVLGLDTMILRECKDPQITEYAMDIENAGRTLLALINDILDLSKIESGKMEIVPMEYELSSLINDVHTMIAEKASSKSLHVNLQLDENLPNVLFGDDVRIRQILVNIMNNAVKYTQQGSVSLIMTGDVEGDEVTLHVAVKDTGIGIKEEDIHKLFAEFERIEEARNRNVEGTGLGMSITIQLLKLMGSKLNVSSVYGEGTTFYFDLKQEIRKHEAVGNLSERLQNRVISYSYQTAFIAPEAELLVVDDTRMNRKVFVNLLKDMQVKIDQAKGGVDALAMLQKKRYDIVFLDHMMPDLNGVQVLEKLREIPDHPNVNTPMVVLTANAISGAKEQYMELGFDEYLSKPIDADKLDQMIGKLLPDELKHPAV